MIKYLTLRMLNIFDFFHQRKIIKFLHKEGFKELKTLLDVGAHKGESIDLFMNNFKIDVIYSFEASPILFKILSDQISYFRNKFKNSRLVIENFAIGANTKKVLLKQLKESSSSTIKNLNENSKYFKKKLFFLQGSKNSNFFQEIEVEQIKLSDYIKKNKICNDRNKLFSRPNGPLAKSNGVFVILFTKSSSRALFFLSDKSNCSNSTST